ncbi:extracellular solute-binding protein [Nocardioides carbamazepini]|uniref:extracellular solute-binding protein n=1 Tax=Nocardioides carbamazepini TaxID=2854259 RepID=UPI002149A603|nr:extracellular solute-binding protein [Nocardioides carbamazepini]MCR1786534.1 extracellular solute-binding protein [Nocardioides carbamazepini]
MGRFTWRTGAVVVGVAVAVLVGMIALASGTEQKKEPHRPKPPAAMKTELEFAAWGSDQEIAAYQTVVDAYNASSQDTSVSVVSWPNADAMLDAIRGGEASPDLYLLPRGDLAETVAEKRNIPLLDLVNEREIPIGDDFARDAVSAFSVDDDLQCLPYAASPMVIYYNTDLVDFAAMDAEGLPTPRGENTGWNFAEFRAAAEFASRPRRNTRGIYIEPTLRGLAPFVYSGGGQLFDDEGEPTRLALGDDGSTDALRQTLELLRDPRLTLSTAQLEKRTALEWFQRGKLAMIAGFRGMTPDLRATEGLNFDVMPMPSLGSPHTIADLNGLCLAPNGPMRTEAAANVLSYLVSDEALARVAETGYVQPAKLTVAFSDDFLQAAQAPEHSAVFNSVMRSVVLAPLMSQGRELRELVDPDIETLLTTPDIADLQEALRAIDEKSRSLLDPDYEPSESPSGASSGEPVDPASSETASDDRG